MKQCTLVFFILLVLTIATLPGCAKVAGPAGANAAPTVVTEQPASPEQCPNGGVQVNIGDTQSVICNGANGAPGATGSTGAAGATGPQGQPGQNGINGTNATPVTTIQFCPGVTPTYPSNFPEYGICLSGNLYAVYSANGGFLALIPPGVYSSDGINASCDFTVRANCEVTND
jgi:hypothetical protein